MILSGDGRVHLAQAKIVFPSGKPVFIDKPLGGTLRDALEIVRLAQASHVPLFSGSSLRYTPAVRQLVAEESSIGSVRGAISYGPAVLEPHHPDLYWYGIHPTEALYSVLGPGCETVSRTSTPDTDVVVGTWQGQRTGVLYGIRNQGNSYGLTVFGSKRIINADPGVGYRPFLAAMMEFFRTRVTPVPLTETIEIMTFMEAADESKRRGGAAVSLREVLEMNSR